MTAFWYIAQALGVLLNAAIIQIPMALLYEFFFYFVLMVLVTTVFLVINRNYHRRDGVREGEEEREGERERKEREDRTAIS